MRILQCIASVDRAGGGPVESMIQVSKVLTELGHQTEVASLDAANAPFLRNFPLNVHALGPGQTTYQYSARFVPWLRECASSYDCVLVRGLWRFTTIGTRRALQNSAVPYFVFPHGMLDPWFKRRYPMKHIQKYFFWFAGEYAALRDAQAVLFTTEAERQLAKQSFFPNVWNERVVRYGTAAPPKHLSALREEFFQKLPELHDKKILLFLGRIHPKKGCDYLIQSFARCAADHPELALVMAGPDQIGWGRTLCEMAKSLGCAERIFWLGMVSGDDKWAAYAAADAFVLPSHQENFGISVAEALGCGLPVLISDKVNICDDVAEAAAGFVEPDTQAGTDDLLQQWIATSDGKLKEMATAGRGLFLDKFEVTAAARSLLSVLGS